MEADSKNLQKVLWWKESVWWSSLIGQKVYIFTILQL